MTEFIQITCRPMPPSNEMQLALEPQAEKYFSPPPPPKNYNKQFDISYTHGHTEIYRPRPSLWQKINFMFINLFGGFGYVRGTGVYWTFFFFGLLDK